MLESLLARLLKKLERLRNHPRAAWTAISGKESTHVDLHMISPRDILVGSGHIGWLGGLDRCMYVDTHVIRMLICRAVLVRKRWKMEDGR